MRAEGDGETGQVKNARKEQNMGRKPKHPDHAAESQRLVNELLDEVVQLWKEQPELKAIV